MTTITTQLEIASDLVRTLQAITKTEADLEQLHTQRLELLTSLNDGKILPTPNNDKPKPTKTNKKAPEPTPDITPEAQAKYEQQDDLYAAGIEKITPAQGKMIFAILGTERGFSSNEDKKAIIAGIIAKLHKGWKLESTTDLSKVWAGDVITYLQTHTHEELREFLNEPF